MSPNDSVDYLNTKVRISFEENPQLRYELSKTFQKESEVLLVELPGVGGKGAGPVDIVSLFHEFRSGLLIEFGLLAKTFLDEVNGGIIKGLLKTLRRSTSVTNVFLFRKDGKIMATILVPAKLTNKQAEKFKKAIQSASRRKQFRGVFAFAPNSGELVQLESYNDPSTIKQLWLKLIERYNNWRYPNAI